MGFSRGLPFCARRTHSCILRTINFSELIKITKIIIEFI